MSIVNTCQAAIDHPDWDINVEDELGLVMRHESGASYEVGLTYGQNDHVKQWSTTFWHIGERTVIGDELDNLIRYSER